MNAPRFEMNADDLATVRAYFQARAVQGLMDGFRWDPATEELSDGGAPWGVRTHSTDRAGQRYQSVYVYARARGRGHLSRYVARGGLAFVTGPDCDLERFFQSRGVPYVLAGAFTAEREYRAVERHYADGRAQRSGLYFMNHIDEGVAVLRALGASASACRAFALHPMVQLDAALPATIERLDEVTRDPRALALAMEYRSVANAYLSRREIASLDDIALGPLPEVHAMLRADKVQNFKDFLLYHRATHPRREALMAYFTAWLAKLDVSESRFGAFFEALQVRDAPVPYATVAAEIPWAR